MLNTLHSSLKKHHTTLPLIFALLISLSTYTWIYFTYTHSPGVSLQYPLGWWGWLDQSWYLKAAQDFASGHITRDSQFYPPLYPLLGSLFIPLSTDHSFFIPDLILFLTYVWMFMRLFGRYIGQWSALASLFIGLYQYHILNLQWATPWTSSLAALLSMSALYFYDNYLKYRKNNENYTRNIVLQIFFMALLVGLLAPTRPVDCLAFLPLLIVFGLILIRDTFKNNSRPKLQRNILLLSAAILGSIIPVISYFWFNFFVFGSPLSGYFEVVEKNGGGLLFSNVIERFYSHVFDSFTIYAEDGADWKTKLTTLFICLHIIPVALFVGPKFFRTVALIILTHMLLVYSYADALPTGQFRFFNIHYFKWMYPVLPAILIFYLKKSVLSLDGDRKKYRFATGISLTLFAISNSITPIFESFYSTQVTRSDNGTIKIDFGREVPLDYIDITARDINLGTIDRNDKIALDDTPYLHPRTDYIITPSNNGQRYKLVKEHLAQHVMIETAKEFEFKTALGVKIRYTLDFPWRKNQPPPTPPALPASLIETETTLSAAEDGRLHKYIDKGWSIGENWGRWMNESQATIRFKLPSNLTANQILRITGRGFIIPTLQPNLTIKVLINNTKIGEMFITENSPESFQLPLPPIKSLVSSEVTLKLISSHTLSPAKATINNDDRELSFGLISLGIYPDMDNHARNKF